MSKKLPAIALILALTLAGCLGSQAETLVQWDFNSYDNNLNSGTLAPAIGAGTAVKVGSVAESFTAANGSSDPASDTVDDSNWRITTFPAQGTGNKTAGARFNVSTVGYVNISMVWDQQNSATANKYWRVQYTTDGTSWVDKDVIINTVSAGWNNQVFSANFSAIPGANNNPNFGVRIFSELASTAVGGASSYVPWVAARIA